MPTVFTSSIFQVDTGAGARNGMLTHVDPLEIRSPIPMISALPAMVDLLNQVQASTAVQAMSVSEHDYVTRLSSLQRPTHLRSQLGDTDVLLIMRRPERFRCQQGTQWRIIGLPSIEPTNVSEFPCG
jgi:hypothetical protein